MSVDKTAWTQSSTHTTKHSQRPQTTHKAKHIEDTSQNTHTHTGREGGREREREREREKRRRRRIEGEGCLILMVMEVGMSLNAVVRLPKSSSATPREGLAKHSLFSSSPTFPNPKQRGQQRRALAVEAKGKRGMQARQFQRPPPPPPLPKIEDDGNPRFLIFIRMANVFLWYPLSLVAGGTTAKIMVAAKDNFLGKYIYKDALARNLAAVIYRDEKEVRKSAFKQYRILRSASEFRYGYKFVENNNLRAALTTTDVIELPTQGELKTVVDKVKDFFGDAKESFGKMAALNTRETE